MLEQDLFITNYCSIRNQTISDKSAQVFVSEKIGVDFLHAAYDFFKVDYPKFYKMDALSKMGILATDLLLKNISYNTYQQQQTGIVLANKNSSIEADINYYNSLKEIPSPSLFVYTLPNIVIGEISIRYKFKGENAFFIQNEFDANWMNFYVSDLLNNRGMEACIGGWLDVADCNLEALIFYVEKVKRIGSINFTSQYLEQLYSK